MAYLCASNHKQWREQKWSRVRQVWNLHILGALALNIKHVDENSDVSKYVISL